jgi:hypothetical protein
MTATITTTTTTSSERWCPSCDGGLPPIECNCPAGKEKK